MKSLIVNLCDVGDLLFSTPVIEALALVGEVHYLADATCAAAVRGHPGLARCWTLPRTDWARGLADGSLRGATLAQALAWAEALREERFDEVVCLQPQALAVHLAEMAGGRSLRGFVPDGAGGVAAGPGCQLLFRHLERFECRGVDGLHAAECYLSVLDRRLWPDKARLTFSPDPSRAARAAALLPTVGRRIGLLTGAGGAHKRWGAPAWLAFGRAWKRRHPGDTLVFIGGPDDAPRSGALAARLPGSVDLCGKLDLDGSAAALAACAAVVGGDTGPLHLAAAMGAPCLGLFAETHPSESCPLIPGSLTLRSSTRSMDDIEAPAVVRALEALLVGRTPHGLGRGIEVWPGREAEGGRIAAAWAAATEAQPWLARQERAPDGKLPLKDLAEGLMDRARRGLEGLEGPALALVTFYQAVQFKVFREELP